MQMKKCVVIYNPNSGKKEVDKLLPKFEGELNKYGYTGEIISSKQDLKPEVNNV